MLRARSERVASTLRTRCDRKRNIWPFEAHSTNAGMDFVLHDKRSILPKLAYTTKKSTPTYNFHRKGT